MKRWIGAGLVLALWAGGYPCWGQIVERERDVTITGPRGRSINRSIQTERGPGFIERQVNIQRPGGTFHSDVFAQRARPFGPGPGFFPGPAWRGFGPRPVFVEPVVVNNGIGLGPALLGGAGLFGLGMFAGSAMASSPPPPPAYAAPAQPPNVIYNQPQPYSANPPQPPTVVVDPVVDAVKRLSSHHNHSRRDGALTLGRLRDARAVPALVDRLKNDTSPEVRVASATALGEIGDPRAKVFLERSTIYDKKQAVRDASAQALSRFPADLPVPGSAAPPQGAVVGNPAGPVGNPPPSSVPSAAPIENVPPPPMPEAGFPDKP